MNSNRVLSLLTVLFLVSTISLATIWRVDSNPGNWAHFRTLQAANDSSFVLAGDTLYVAGSPTSYGSVTFIKQLVIIGPGYFLGDNPTTQANPATAKADNVTFGTNSMGSKMMGMTVNNTLYITASNITIQRNYISGWTYLAYNVPSGATNLILSQNYVNSGISTSYAATNTTISNNIIRAYIGGNSTSSLLIVNNVINFDSYSDPLSSVYNSIVENNVLYGGTTTDTALSNIYLNNICNGTYIPLSTANIRSVSMSTVFELTGSPDGRYKLKAASPALGVGTNGYDIGAYGGPAPYVLSGIPPIPTIYNVSAPTFGSEAQGLQVQVKAKSRN